MKSIIRIFALLLICTFPVIHFSCSQKPDLKALILTGQNNHNWKRSSIFLKEILEKSEVFSVDVQISPEKEGNMSDFIVDFTPYDVVVLDYNGDEWPEKTKNNFVSYVKNGGGVVIYHAADNAFPEWQEYNEIIGLGGWGERNESAGPYFYIESGKVVRDDSPCRGGSHGEQHEFKVYAYNPDHPILKGLPEIWLHTRDELYSELRGAANNLEVLAYAYADRKYKGTGRNEPVLITILYGKGRIFHTVLGHAGGGLFAPAMECAGFVTTLQRGAEWAASGKVTQEVPVSFPTENNSLQWPFFEDIHTDIALFVNKMQKYEIGQSNESFNIFQTLMRENLNDPEKINEYHSIILELLKSKKTTDDCKKILLKESSWMADESYKEIYEKLKQKTDLEEEAKYALDKLNFQ
ncbi:MAG: ThuA domain-containing protein [Prolixibacteraceae bacterium]